MTLLAIRNTLVILLTLFTSFLTNKYPCNPQKKKLIGKFLLQQWLNAQMEVGLEESQLISDMSASDLEYLLININSFSAGVRVFYARNGRPITYAVMWKCASEGITQNLKALTLIKPGSNAPQGGIFNYDIKIIRNVHVAMSNMKELASAAPTSIESED